MNIRIRICSDRHRQCFGATTCDDDDDSDWYEDGTITITSRAEPVTTELMGDVVGGRWGMGC